MQKLFNDISNEEKHIIANNIIITHDLHLSADQIIAAFKKIRNWFNSYLFSPEYVNKRLFLLDTVLNINKNMYIAIILALCDNFEPYKLMHFIIFEKNESVSVGLHKFYIYSAIKSYKKLLDYYEFDVSNISTISEENKKLIQSYRASKYSGKSTKCAKK